MPKFSIDWKEIVYYNADIEADTKEDAIKIFHSDDGPLSNDDNVNYREFEYVTGIVEYKDDI
jgi:hypothetical protein